MQGIVTVLNTPFTDRDTLDREGLARNVRHAMDAGVAGFLVPALASEVHALSEEERAEMVACVTETTRGRVPVVGGSAARTQAERVRYARQLVDAGCAGVLVNMPLEDEAVFARDLEELADLGADFVMLQDWDATGTGLPVRFIARLFERVPRFSWLKIEVVPAGPKYTEVLEATGGGLRVAGGWAVQQMIDGLDRGVHAFMPTGLHRTYARIDALHRAGRRDEARALFERVLPILAFSNQRLDLSIRFFKRLLHGQGLYATPRVRDAGVPFDPVQERIAAELIARAMELEGEV